MLFLQKVEKALVETVVSSVESREIFLRQKVGKALLHGRKLKKVRSTAEDGEVFFLWQKRR